MFARNQTFQSAPWIVGPSRGACSTRKWAGLSKAGFSVCLGVFGSPHGNFVWTLRSQARPTCSGKEEDEKGAGPWLLSCNIHKRTKKVRPFSPLLKPTHMSRAQNKLLPNNATTSRVWHGRVGLISTSRPHRSSQFIVGFHCISAQRESIQILRLHRGQAPRNAWAASGTSTHACAVACISPAPPNSLSQENKRPSKHTRTRTHAHTRTHP